MACALVLVHSDQHRVALGFCKLPAMVVSSTWPSIPPAPGTL